MAGSSFGEVFKVSTFGESHGAALGVIIDGCPAGVPIDMAAVQAALDRRRPGQYGKGLNAAVTTRKEADACELLSGVFEGRTTGTSIALLIRNTSQLPKDYDNLKRSFRPGHADLGYTQKYGFRDHRGGGRSSGRETAARVAAGAIADAMLKAALGSDFLVRAYTIRAGGITADERDLSVIEANTMRAPDLGAAELMEARVAELRRQGDSCGGIVECLVSGLPAGLGEPVFDKYEAMLAHAILSIGAVRGFEIGEGFAAPDLTGSVMNDPIRSCEGGRSVYFESNHSGGVSGGITTGAPLVFRAAVKPVSSIFKTQHSVEITDDGLYEDIDLRIEGRHDVCLCPRIVPVIEAMALLTAADLYLRNKTARIRP